MYDFADTGTGSRPGSAVDVTADRALLAAQSGTLWTNASATGTIRFTLPTPSAGLQFDFIVAVAQLLEIRTDDDEELYIGTVSAVPSVAGEYSLLYSNEQGASVTLRAVSDTQWFASGSVGVWDLVVDS